MTFVIAYYATDTNSVRTKTSAVNGVTDRICIRGYGQLCKRLAVPDRPKVIYPFDILRYCPYFFFRRDIIMELSWKKYAAALTAAVCLLVPLADMPPAAAENAQETGGAGMNWGFDWSVPYEADDEGTEEVSYPTDTPEPSEEELKKDHITGQRDGIVYNIYKKSGENGAFTYANGVQNGFTASWSGMEELKIEKGKLFKKPVAVSDMQTLSLDYKAAVSGFSGDQLDIGAKCQIGYDGCFMYVIDHFGDFVPDEDMTELPDCEYYGITYKVYKREFTENKEGSPLLHQDYYFVCLRDIDDISSGHDLVSSVMIKDIAESISMNYRIPPFLSLCFYADTYGADADIDVKYIQFNNKTRAATPGMLPWNTNIWGQTEQEPEKIKCILYPDENGYYYYNSGSSIRNTGGYFDFESGTVIAVADDFGSGDERSLNVKCSRDNFKFEQQERFSALIGNVGEPYTKGSNWNDKIQGFSFGPLYYPDEYYYDSDISYDISFDVYNCSDSEAEFSLEINMPVTGIDVEYEEQDKWSGYEGNIVCRKTVKPHEWTTISNPCYAMPKALMGNLLLYTNDEIEYYVDNISVKDIETASKVRGDINGDGVLDSLDLIQYRRSFLTNGNTRRLPRRADIDGDGNVYLNDVVLLKRFLLSIDREFGEEQHIKADITESGEKDGFFYESSVKDGTGEIAYEIGENGTFDCSVYAADCASFECGVRPEEDIGLSEMKSLYHVYEAEILGDDGYLFGIHGTFADSPDEFYIIEDSGQDSRFAGTTYKNGYFSEGYYYRYYVVNKLRDTPEGRVSYDEYWCVMDDYRPYTQGICNLRGQINILSHIRNIEKCFGAKLMDRKLGSVSAYVGGNNLYSPSFSVSRNELFIKK